MPHPPGGAFVFRPVHERLFAWLGKPKRARRASGGPERSRGIRRRRRNPDVFYRDRRRV